MHPTRCSRLESVYSAALEDRDFWNVPANNVPIASESRGWRLGNLVPVFGHHVFRTLVTPLVEDRSSVC